MEGGGLFEANDFLWKELERLKEENRLLRDQLSQRDQSRQRLIQLQQEHHELLEHNRLLKARIEELSQQLKSQPKTAPSPLYKANAPRRRGRLGREKGHAAAVRPMPDRIDVEQDVPLPVDAAGKPSCPSCKTQLSDIKHHDRLVEDIVPARVIVTRYHTTSGYCPCCRKTVESRADEQPPAWDLPHAQLGINALSTASVLRVCYRLPLRQVQALFQQLPGLKISPGGIAKQLQRLSKLLEKQYHRLKLSLRLAGVVHADETGWRTNGRNGYLWTLSSADHTLYHIDRSRSGKVIAGLLGEGFGADGKGTLVSDFYSAYDQFKGSQQKCLAHLLRELKDTVRDKPQLSGHAFFKRCRRLVKDMMRLKARREQLPGKVYEHQVQLVENRLKQLGQGRWDDSDASRLAARISKYQSKLTTFLHKAEVDATNNAAERALRPAVVMRKITGGSRSPKGAQAWAILASVMRTAQQQGKDVVETIQALLKAEWAGKEATLLTELLMPTILADTT